MGAPFQAFSPVAPASAAPASQAFVVAGRAGELPSDRPVAARLGEKVTAWAVLRLHEGRRWQLYSDAPALSLRRRRYRRGRRGAAGLKPLSALGRLRVRWWRVEPRPHHVKTRPPNPGNPAYSNAHLFGPKHGSWLGYDTLEYKETPIFTPAAKATRAATASRLVLSRTNPSHVKVNVNGGLGTMRYKVTIELLDRGQTLASFGKDRVGKRGISPRVLRVTFRSGDDFPGYLRGFFNVPNVFGSGGHGRHHQTDLYQGADCADVIVGALRAAGARVPYTSARGLTRYTRPVTQRLLLTKSGVFTTDGTTPVALRFGVAPNADLRSGDIMLIDYKDFQDSPRSWDHVAVLDHDRGVRGRFDPADPILHMGYLYGLTEKTAAGEAPAYVQFLRLRLRYRRAIDRHRRRLRRLDARRRRRAGVS